MTTTITRTPEQEARRRNTVVWVVGLAFVGLVFDGYDLVVCRWTIHMTAERTQ